MTTIFLLICIFLNYMKLMRFINNFCSLTVMLFLVHDKICDTLKRETAFIDIKFIGLHWPSQKIAAICPAL